MRHKVRQKIVTWIEFQIEVDETETLEDIIKNDPEIVHRANDDLECEFHAEEVIVTEIYPEEGGEYPVIVWEKENSDILTKTKLLKMNRGDIFASGFTVNSPEGVYMSDNFLGAKLKWVAVKGFGNDWAIYVSMNTLESDEITAKRGDKVHDKDNIRKLVKCTDEVLKLYRH